MKILDLFSGAGGLTEGFRTKEYEIINHIEMDKDACFTLKTREAFHYLKETGNLDIYHSYLNGEANRTELYNLIPAEILEKVQNLEINQENITNIFHKIDRNLSGEKLFGIIGGPPCQAYSTIGRAQNKKIKENDSRIYLYEYYVQFLERYHPNFFVFENVKGLLSFKDQFDEYLFPKIIDAFSNVGYTLDYRVIKAQEYGVSQKRERLFIIGIKNSIKKENSFFKSLESFKETPININSLFSDLPKLHSGEQKSDYRATKIDSYIAKYIRPHSSLPLTYQIARPNNVNDLKIYKIVAKAKKIGRNIRYSDIPSNLQTHKNNKVFLDRFKAIDGDSFSHTIVAHISKDGHHYIHPDPHQNRSITVREAARIQSFPDDYYFESSRTAAFKQIGNAVPPVLARKIANNILLFFAPNS